MIRKTASTLMVLGILCVGLPAMAVPFMGNWEGNLYVDGAPEADAIARVIGTGNDTYVVQLELSRDQYSFQGELSGMKRNNAAVFAGHIDMGSQLGGVYTVTLEVVEGHPMTGILRGEAGDDIKLELNKVYKQPPNLGAEPPEDAIVLFDGTDIDEWNLHPGNIRGGAMQVTSNHFVSKREFGDHTLHLEFATPYMPQYPPGSQARGNSGLYMQGRYEIQILDSFGEAPADNFCGGVYQIAAPLSNPSLPPNEWQTYRVEFRAPRFNDAGEKIENARMTVYHNGVLTHDDLELPHPTGGALGEEVPEGPIFLQDHGGDPVRFRNIWVIPHDE